MQSRVRFGVPEQTVDSIWPQLSILDSWPRFDREMSDHRAGRPPAQHRRRLAITRPQ